WARGESRLRSFSGESATGRAYGGGRGDDRRERPGEEEAGHHGSGAELAPDGGVVDRHAEGAGGAEARQPGDGERYPGQEAAAGAAGHGPSVGLAGRRRTRLRGSSQTVRAKRPGMSASPVPALSRPGDRGHPYWRVTVHDPYRTPKSLPSVTRQS